MTIIESKILEIKQSSSVLSFQTTGSTAGKVWDRYLAIDGRKAFHIGNVCGTCNFFFERLEGANQKISAKVLIDKLANNKIQMNSDEYFEIEKLIPTGNYVVFSLSISPKLVVVGTKEDYFVNEDIQTWGIDGFWGIPHHPKINYYREIDMAVDERKKIYNFFVPIVPDNWLEKSTRELYEKKFSAGITPTAIAISYLDIKEPADWEEGKKHTQHICFANFILDGHHKFAEAARLGKKLNLITFLSVDNSVATKEDIGNLENDIKKFA